MAQTLKRVANNGNDDDFMVIGDTQGGFAPNPNNKYIGPPDYGKMETVNLLSPAAGNGSCTVSADGYVVCGSTSTANVRFVTVNINGKQTALSGQDAGNNGPIRIGPLPVAAGDTVSVSAAGAAGQGIFCYFIPPRYVEFPVLIGNAQSSSAPDKIAIDPVTREMSVNTVHPELAFLPNASVASSASATFVNWGVQAAAANEYVSVNTSGLVTFHKPGLYAFLQGRADGSYNDLWQPMLDGFLPNPTGQTLAGLGGGVLPYMSIRRVSAPGTTAQLRFTYCSAVKTWTFTNVAYCVIMRLTV